MSENNLKQMPIGEVHPNPDNPRTISKAKLAQLKESIENFPKMLKLRPIVVDGNMVVLGGNQRLEALRQLGFKQVWVLVADNLTEAEKREFIIKDNLPFGEWDWEMLQSDWDKLELENWGMDLEDWEEDEPETADDGYEVPDEIETSIQLGDLIEIGPHRLLCGDSTKAEDVARLMDGAAPALMVTDPPYGVNYDPSWRDKALGEGNRATGVVRNDIQPDWSGAWELSPADVAYVWHAGKFAAIVAESLQQTGFEIRNQIIWAKSHFAIGRGNYHWQHEPCWYAVKAGHKTHWAGARDQSTLWEIEKPRKNETGHGTQKHLECMARPIENHKGDVYDPFLGSGTTMVAAHQLGRICYGMELDPKYCQVIVERMLKLDDSLPVLINGETYNPEKDG